MCRYIVTTTDGNDFHEVGMLAENAQSAVALAEFTTGELPVSVEPVLNRYEVTLWDGLRTFGVGVKARNAESAILLAQESTGHEAASVTEVA